ncbi:mercuric reductase [Pedobacter aquatilis]|uniref:mercuric reductase n=1 Tax=Pedobacter aquatilis TaxID=351343 RepID=UPI00292E958A|nr:mercuric reductase [Pedobacter aquatilis]
MKKYDAIIIGAGQAGVPLAKKLAQAGKKTALIEKRLIGGTCINDGCTPTKAMIASARTAYQARNAAALGVTVGKVKVNLKKIIQRKDKIVESFRTSSEKGIANTSGLDLYMGEATFVGKKQILVTHPDGKQESLTAELIFINTGAETIIPEIEGLADIDFLTSTTMLELKTVPKHLVIIGGNYIGLEFGQMFSRFGSKVTILEKSDRILSKEDEDVANMMSDILIEEKIDIITSVKVNSFSREKSKTKINIKVGNKTRQLKASHILLAVGRKPQTASLGLALCGIKTDDKGHVLVNDKLETNVKGIYALGDVKGGPAFTHIAYNDYTIVYRNLIEGTNFSSKDRPVPYCMFTDPQLGRIGLSETEAKAKKLNYRVAVLPMSAVARGIETGETRGMMKAVIDPKSGKILGAAILAAEGGEVMSVIQMAMEGGISYAQLRYCVFAHPTYSESLNNLFMKIES